MSLTCRRTEERRRRFPRVSGDEPFADQGLSLDGLFSPRERG